MSNKIISLISEGLDSPISSYLMLKKGYIPVFVSFLTSKENHVKIKKKIIQIINHLKKYSEIKFKLYLIKQFNFLEDVIGKCNRKLTCILCKRVMIRISISISRIEETNLLLMGDILAEQASQTLSNLESYNDLVKEIVLLRPLIGLNKLEVINMNREIKLYDITSRDVGTCQYYPKYPETNAKKEDITFAESLLNFEKIINKSINKAEVLKF